MSQPAPSADPPPSSVDAEFAAAGKALAHRITRQRLAPWLNLPARRTRRFSFDLAPLTLGTLAALEHAGNKFISGPQDAPEADLLAYVWAHLRSRPRFKKYCRICARTDLDALRMHALAHYAQAVSENPAPLKHGQTSIDYRLPPVPSVATITDELAAAYGQDPRTLLDWPVQLAFQLMRAGRRRAHAVEFPDHPEMVHLKSLYLQALAIEQEEKEASHGA